VDKSALTVRTIFDRARELATPHERHVYLDRVCGHNDELRQRVEALLHAYDEACNFANRSTAPPESDSVESSEPVLPPDALPATLNTRLEHTPSEMSGDSIDSREPDSCLEDVGSRLGPYKLLQQIGEGGMGVVFMAEQQEPVRRMVAVKVVKAGMDSAQVIARFEAERQALALMDHPNIARVLDANKTENGRPYFVMELVKGIPITRYCDEQRLSPRQRLELFIPVCQAIQHAHQKGIIHRDIKPSNVLVATYDGKPVPKVIDFGVAKAMGQKLTDRTLFTGLGGIVGTLPYMSPEQADLNTADIDTRSDLYSLGVLLYELLTGTTPIMRQRIREVAFTEILRLIREEEPPRPSTRLAASHDELASLSAQRQMDSTALVKAVRGEVDWIVMKALEKDRTRRYETANGLARDIQRYLAEEPVEAGPPSATYRMRKLAWKHRRGLATAAAVLLLLVSAVLVSTSLAFWGLRAEKQARDAEGTANQQRDKALTAEEAAKRSAEDTKTVLAFFQDNVLSAGRPEGKEGGLGNKVTLRQAVDAAEPQIAGAFADRPLVEASIRDTLGQTYYFLGEYPQAIKQLDRGLTLRQAHLGPEHADTLASRNNLATAYWSAGRTTDAISLHQQTLRQQEIQLGLDHPDTLGTRNNLGLAYWTTGRIEDAILLHEQNLKLCEAKLGPNSVETLQARNNLAAAYWSAGRIDDAIRLNEETLGQREIQLGADHPDTLSSRNNLAEAYRTVGRIDDAIRLNKQTLKQREAKLESDHPDTLQSRNNLALTYWSAGRTQEAIPLFEQTLRQKEAKLGPNHPDTIISRNNLAGVYDQIGKYAEAESLARISLEQMRSRFGAENPQTIAVMAILGLNLLHQHKFAEAEPILRDCLKAREANQADSWTTFNTQSMLGESLLGQKRFAQAETFLLSGYEGMKQREKSIPPQNQTRLKEARERLVQLYEATGKKAEAEKWRKEREQARRSDPEAPDRK
jgi:serine/threonine protein kinase